MAPIDRTQMSDTALVFAVSRFDSDALGEIYRRHAGAMASLCHRVLRDRSLAEEVVQEVFVRLWQEPERFDPTRGSLRSWLLSQCHSRSVDLIRSEESRRTRETRQMVSDIDAADLEREVADLIVAERVRSALRELPEAEQLPILLAYFGGHTYREVADLLEVPEGTIKSRIRSGLTRLKSGLDGVAGGVT